MKNTTEQSERQQTLERVFELASGLRAWQCPTRKALEAIRESAEDGREIPEWLAERLVDAPRLKTAADGVCGDCEDRIAAVLESVEQETETRVKLETAQRCAEIARGFIPTGPVGPGPLFTAGLHAAADAIEAAIRAEFGITEGKS